MKKLLMAFAVIFFITSFISKETNAQTPDFYKKNWTTVDSLMSKGLPRSSINIIDKIFDRAKSENNQDQILKSYVYYFRTRNFQENSFDTMVYMMETDLKTAPFPNNCIMHSMLGELYWQYYRSNLWRISNRTEISDYIPQDLQTWTAENFIEKCIYHFNASLDNADQLQKTDIGFYDEMIEKGTKPKELRPTLYDFLASRAVDFYSNPEASITRPLDYFQVDDDLYYESTSIFANNSIKSNDTLSLHYNGIKILQSWLKFRLSKPKEENALVDADFRRLQFVHNLSVNPQKDKLYFDALLKLEAAYPNASQTGYVKLAIARYYYQRASKYNPDDISTAIYKGDFIIAKKLYQKIIEDYKKYDEIWQSAQSMIYSIEAKTVSISTEKVIPTGTSFPSKITYKNINKIYVEIRSLNYDDYIKFSTKLYDYELIEKIRNKGKLVKTYEYDLKGTDNYMTHTTEIISEGLKTGGYYIIVSSSKDFKTETDIATSFFQVSDLSIVQQEIDDGSLECFVLDRKTGSPVPGVNIKAQFQKYNYTLNKYIERTYGTYISDKNGRFVVKSKRDFWESIFFKLSSSNDSLVINDYSYIYYDENTKYESTNVSIFTDRKLYRPGQTVYFKGILINRDKNDQVKIVPNRSVLVTLFDVNWQEVSKQTLTTNEFGTINGTFQIPTGLLNGTMTIHTAYGSFNIQVEEYKRPTFFAEILPVDKQYLVNDKVTINGKAENYSGVKLSDANVKYTVTRKNLWFGWWWWNFRSEEVLVAHGNVKTDSNGLFEFKFDAVPDLQMPRDPNTAFSYYITVDVTDINGETQSTSSAVNVGYTALNVSSNIKEKISLEEINNDYDTIVLSSQNLNGQNVTSVGSIAVYKLKLPSNSLKSKYWTKPDEPIYTKDEWNKLLPNYAYKDEADFRYWDLENKVWSTKFNTALSSKVSISDFNSLGQGVYKMVIKSTDAFGNGVVTEQFFTIYSEKGKTLAYKTADWFVPIETYCEPGENAKFLIGSSNKTTVIYQIVRDNEILKREFIDLNNNQKLIEIPITEEMRGGFSVSFIFETQNRVYVHSSSVVVPYTNKELDFEFTTFRDKLQPGQQEEWQIIIKDKAGDLALSEVMTTLYDASLDAIMPNYWYFNPYLNFYGNLYWRYNSFGTAYSNSYRTYSQPSINPASYYYSKLNWMSYYYYSWGYGYFGGDVVLMDEITTTGVMYKSSNKKDSERMAVSEELEVDGAVVLDQSMPVDKETSTETEDVQVRKNFNETAFFYPDLKTNDKGEFVISFIVPESLTEWKLLGLAHTKDLKFGQFEKKIVTQKELMVMPNAPRFYRQNDTMFFAAKIANLSDQNLNGTVTLEFIDEITGKTVDILAKGENKSKNFSVSQGLNTPVSWKIIIPDDAKMLTYKIIAKAGNFSDGEQKPLPVLSNRILVTESLPLPIRANQTKDFKFVKLINSAKSKTIKTEKLTLEFTSNPAWYAVQALPYLIEYPYECSEQTFARYYANSLASHIANSSPKIKAVFDTWKNYQPSALLSNLEKNQELKQVILEETPWVLEAQDEGERKQRIALLFDLNRMANEKASAMRKLKRDQTINGGWPWFKGMPESWYITQYIAEGIGHLKKLGVLTETDIEEMKMAEKAIVFTDGEMKKSYDWIMSHYTKEQIEKYRPSEIVIHYMYTRTFFEYQLDTKYQKAYDYFYGQLKKYWLDYRLYSKGMLAIIFYRTNEKVVAADIVKSLKENALYHDELGMYWKENVAGYYWYQAPIETQALMIEVFDEVANDPNSVDELKIWLMKNKQTNDWKTTTATAKAIYSLLLTGGVDLLANSEVCPVTLGSKTIDPQNDPDIQTEAGTGYYKIVFNGSEVTPDMGKVTVVNKNNIVAWGALYWQYWEDIDKITPHETPLKLKKDLYKEVMTDRGSQLVKIDDKTELEIGDKIIVRIELRVDREMEYVHMKDMRAASFEPLNVISRYKWQDGLGYYETTKDASTNFFFDYLPKGTYVFEYPLRASVSGSFSNGITTIQCMYAPEFMSHSQGQRVHIAKQK